MKWFVNEKNIVKMRELQLETHNYYGVDASQYDNDNGLKIRTIYDLIPSFMENRKKRVVVKEIGNKKGETFEKYQDEFDYLIASGIANDVKAVPSPVYPLAQGMEKNLLKLYLNDVGILTALYLTVTFGLSSTLSFSINSINLPLVTDTNLASISFSKISLTPGIFSNISFGTEWV